MHLFYTYRPKNVSDPPLGKILRSVATARACFQQTHSIKPSLSTIFVQADIMTVVHDGIG